MSEDFQEPEEGALTPEPPEYTASGNENGGQETPHQSDRPDFSAPGPDAGARFAPPPNYTRPLAQTLQELPAQYKKILSRPGVSSFLEEQDKATWRSIWVQMLLMVLIPLALSALDSILTFSERSLIINPHSLPGLLVFTPLTAEGLIGEILGQLPFLGYLGLQFGLARALRGTGSFKQHVYTQLLFTVPITTLLALAGRILSELYLYASLHGQGSYTSLLLFLQIVLPLAGGVYMLILNVYSLIAVHRLSGERAIAVALLPLGAFFLLIIMVLVGLLHAHVMF